MTRRILLTGATGFVGGRLHPLLTHAGYEVRCGSRRPEAAIKAYPDRHWVELDLDRPETLDAALSGCDAAYYLVHQMAGAADYATREALAARRFAVAAERAGLRRIVYLGGVAPQGQPSRHLASRLETGRILREGAVPTVELRASMIIGHGSASWRICRDLAARLPAMILPRWLRSRTEPVAIQDVLVALVAALDLPTEGPMVLDVPGPEALAAKAILTRIARQLGHAPIMIEVPLLSPRLSTYWIELVSGADAALTRELVEGLRSDLLAYDEGIWRYLPDHRRLSFDEAARIALAEEAGHRSPVSRAVESLAHAVSAKTPPELR